MEIKNFLNPAFRKLTKNEFTSFQNLYTNFVQKNSELNLSAIRDEQGIWEKHFYDALLGAEFISDSDAKILDLGSGGGFPAFPLAIVFPEKKFFPFDSVGKKMKAAQEIAQKSGIENVSTIVGRAEELGQQQKYREQFDVVTVRAFASFSVCLELAFPFVKVDGKILLYRGPESEDDAELLTEAFGGFLRNRKVGKLPSGDQREIWEIVKLYPTEKRFPRGNGIPKSMPMTLEGFEF